VRKPASHEYVSALGVSGQVLVVGVEEVASVKRFWWSSVLNAVGSSWLYNNLQQVAPL